MLSSGVTTTTFRPAKPEHEVDVTGGPSGAIYLPTSTVSQVPSYQAVCAAFPADLLAGNAAQIYFSDTDRGGRLLLEMVHRAVASSPARSLSAAFLVKGGSTPGVAVVGALDGPALSRIEELFSYIREVTSHFNFVGYESAAQDCTHLADVLERRVGLDVLRDARFVGIPRGGLIVLGMLSIVMGLRHDQLGPQSDAAELTVIVDDLALTGYQLRRSIDAADSDRLAIALLRAPEALCGAVEAAEPRVLACVAARPLRDAGPDRLGSGYEAWVDQWRTLTTGSGRYWIGRPEAVYFAWKEPDRSFLNEATGVREDGWRVLPRAICLGRRSVEPACTVYMQPTSQGPIRPSDDVFFGPVGEDFVIVVPDEERVLGLDAVSRAIWRAITDVGTVAGAVSQVSEHFDVDHVRVAVDVERFVHEFVRRGILVDDRSTAVRT